MKDVAHLANAARHGSITTAHYAILPVLSTVELYIV